MLGMDVFETIAAELMESETSEDDIILDIIEQDGDIEEAILANCLQLFGAEKRNSIINHLQEAVPLYTEEEFRQHFRISRDLYINISARFNESEMYAKLRADKRLPATTYLAVFLWYAGHEACIFRDLSDRFNLSLSTASKIIEKTTMFISSLSPDVIKWPNEVKKQESAIFLATNVDLQKL